MLPWPPRTCTCIRPLFSGPFVYDGLDGLDTQLCTVVLKFRVFHFRFRLPSALPFDLLHAATCRAYPALNSWLMLLYWRLCVRVRAWSLWISPLAWLVLPPPSACSWYPLGVSMSSNKKQVPPIFFPNAGITHHERTRAAHMMKRRPGVASMKANTSAISCTF